MAGNETSRERELPARLGWVVGVDEYQHIRCSHGTFYLIYRIRDNGMTTTLPGVTMFSIGRGKQAYR